MVRTQVRHGTSHDVLIGVCLTCLCLICKSVVRTRVHYGTSQLWIGGYIVDGTGITSALEYQMMCMWEYLCISDIGGVEDMHVGSWDSCALWNVALHSDWSMSNSGVVKTHVPCGTLHYIRIGVCLTVVWSRLTCPVGGQDSLALWNVALHTDWSMSNSGVVKTHMPCGWSRLTCPVERRITYGLEYV